LLVPLLKNGGHDWFNPQNGEFENNHFSPFH